jgi:ribonuclease HII
VAKLKDEQNPGRRVDGFPFPLAGVDEAGRGCLAGPVVAAAVILPEGCSLSGLTDSKLLSPDQRSHLELDIKAAALSWSLGLSWPREIDRINILQASLAAMGRALAKLRVEPALALVDGNQTPETSVPCQCFPRADARFAAVSAASVLAKTFRDRLMEHLDRRYPGYGFKAHKGYGTKLHLESLKRLGPSVQHRMSFKPLLASREQRKWLPGI